MYRFLILSIAVILISCNNQQAVEKKDPKLEESDSIPQSSYQYSKVSLNETAKAIAEAHGIKNWDEVKEIKFTFNVDRSKNHFERSWIWNPKDDKVTLISKDDTLSYNRKELDSTNLKTDQSFINDKYWLLAPFNLVLDENTKISTTKDQEAPISKQKMNKLTLVYPDQGGYTPGDAYDFFYDENLMIKEWIYRKNNVEKPSMITTWEDYQDFKGVKISTSHQNEDDSLKLYFTNIEVK